MERKPVAKIVLVAVLALGISVLLLWGARALILEFAWSQWANLPMATVVPEELTDTGVDAGEGKALEAFGCRAETPYSELARVEGTPAVATFTISNGRKVVLTDPATTLDIRQAFLGQADDERAREELVRVLGEEALASNHAFMTAVLKATPEDGRRFDDERRIILVGLKAALAMNGETGIFSFEWPGLRGFQFGDPAKTNRVLVQAVDSKDRPLELFFVGETEGFTQAEINRVLSTFTRE
ncbi:MAG: hypothetical protein ABFS86_08985 [Planctomycetota bacterium]